MPIVIDPQLLQNQSKARIHFSLFSFFSCSLPTRLCDMSGMPTENLDLV